MCRAFYYYREVLTGVENTVSAAAAKSFDAKTGAENTASAATRSFAAKQLLCYSLALVRIAPTREPTRASGEIRTNSHSKTWNAVPRTAVSGSPKFQLR